MDVRVKPFVTEATKEIQQSIISLHYLLHIDGNHDSSSEAKEKCSGHTLVTGCCIGHVSRWDFLGGSFLRFSEQFDNPTYCITVMNAVGSEWEQIAYSRFNIAL